MRWVVRGRDAVSGQKVTLEVQGPEAMLAVQAAHAKGLVVTHVRGVGENGSGRAVLMMAWAAAVLMVGMCGVLYWAEENERAMVGEKGRENARLAGEVARMEGVVKQTEADRPPGEVYGQLEAARAKIGLLENALKAPAEDAGMKREWMAALAAADARTAAARAEADRLHGEVKLRSLAIAGVRAERETIRGELQRLAAKNKELEGELDVVKSQLLIAAAKPVVEAAVVKDADGEAVSARGPARWALRVGFETAADFVGMHFGKETMRTVPLGDGEVSWMGTSAGSAATVDVRHDEKKQRVYWAELKVSLAADGPKQKVAENLRLAGDFVRAFAPDVKHEGAWVDRVVGALSVRDGSERSVMIGGDTKVSVWNDGVGLFTWRVESVANELGG